MSTDGDAASKSSGSSLAASETKKTLTKAPQDSAVWADLITEIELRKERTSTPAGLVSMFEENKLKASKKDKGEIVMADGASKRIGLDILDNPCITLGTGYGIRSVQCTFEAKAAVAQLSKGLKKA